VKKGGFSQEQDHIQKTLSMFTQVSLVWEIQADLYNSFFRFENSGISCFSHHL
jgi:hypothetical protein